MKNLMKKIWLENLLIIVMLFVSSVIYAQTTIRDSHTIPGVKRTDITIPFKDGQPNGRAVCSITSLPSLKDQSYKYTLIVNVVNGKAKRVECTGFHKYAITKYDYRKHDYVLTGKYKSNHMAKIDELGFNDAKSLIDALRYGNAAGIPKKKMIKGLVSPSSSNSERPEYDYDEGEDEEEVDDCIIDFSEIKELKKYLTP